MKDAGVKRTNEPREEESISATFDDTSGLLRSIAVATRFSGGAFWDNYPSFLSDEIGDDLVVIYWYIPIESGDFPAGVVHPQRTGVDAETRLLNRWRCSCQLDKCAEVDSVRWGHLRYSILSESKYSIYQCLNSLLSTCQQ